MDEIGWKHFGFGIIPTLWTQYQEEHLKQLGSKLTGQLWMSRLIRQVWALHKKMWLDRNSYVHKPGRSIHQAEEEAVNEAIKAEFARGRDGIPLAFDIDINGRAERITEEKDLTRKQQWLASIWYARDFLRKEQDLDPEERDPLAQAFITRFHLRRKRKRDRINCS